MMEQQHNNLIISSDFIPLDSQDTAQVKRMRQGPDTIIEKDGIYWIKKGDTVLSHRPGGQLSWTVKYASS